MSINFKAKSGRFIIKNLNKKSGVYFVKGDSRVKGNTVNKQICKEFKISCKFCIKATKEGFALIEKGFKRLKYNSNANIVPDK